jgi:tetratricopeptide (TPR) repeat protein
MQRIHRFSIVLLGLFALGACGRAAEESAADTAPAGVVEEIAITTASDEAREDFLRGQRLLDVGRPQEANAAFKQAAEKEPTFAYAYLNIANSSASAEEFKTNLDRAAANVSDKSEGERLLVEIGQAGLANDTDRQLTLARTLVERYPNSPRAWLALAGVQGGLNQNEPARESIRKALALDPDLFVSHAALGFSYLFGDPKDFDQARQSMERASALDPEEAKGHENLGDVYRALQDLEKAREMYSTAVAKDPELSVAHLKKGHVNSFLGNYDEARGDYDAALVGAREANKVTFANYRAFVSLHADDPAAALAELERVYESADDMGVPEEQVGGARIFTLINAATIALHQDDMDHAAAILERLGQEMRADAERVGDPDFARQQSAALVLLEGQLAARRGDYDAARAKAEENRRLLEEDTNPRRLEGYHGLLGLIELRQQNCAPAVEHFKQSNLTVMYMKYHLALSEECAGNVAEAKRLFEEAGEWNFNSVDFALIRRDALKRAS